MTEILRLKSDKRLRDRLFVAEAMSHPAKGHLGLWEAIIDRYTKPGDWVLDPMAGIGTTLLGALMGRNVICVELEPHFLDTMIDYTCDGQVPSWRVQHHSAVKQGWYVYSEEMGDDIHDEPFNTESEAQTFLTENQGEYDTRSETLDVRFDEGSEAYDEQIPNPSRCGQAGEHQPHYVTGSWAKMRQNGPMLGCELGQVVIVRGDARCLPLNGAGAIVTSPPWEDKTALQDSQWLHAHEPELAERFRQGHVGEKGLPGNTKPEKRSTMAGYTRPVDAVVSSPPFSEATNASHQKRVEAGYFSQTGRGSPGGWNVAGRVSLLESRENIGNQRGDAYWDSMRQVYAECYRVLRPGGVMALVLKGFTRDGKYVDLPTQTAEMVESLGFHQFDHWKRELWSLSFWRILQKRRDPAAFDDRLNYEEVLAFRKDGDGGGIDSVISSPPYEGSFAETDTLERSAENVRRGKDVGLRPDVYTSEGNIAAKGYFKGYTRKGKP